MGISKWNTKLTEQETAKLAVSYARQIPLIAAIGSAIGITVLPLLVEWLESLNDIEVGFEDISGRIQRDFSNLKLKVELEADERNFLRTIDRARELQEVFAQLGQTAEDAQDKKIDFTKLFSDPKDIKNQIDSIRQLDELNQVTSDLILKELANAVRRENFGRTANPSQLPLGVGFNVGDRARPLLTEQEIRELNA